MRQTTFQDTKLILLQRKNKKSELSELSFENAVEGILKSFLPNLNQSQNVVYYQDTEYRKEEKSSRTFLM